MESEHSSLWVAWRRRAGLTQRALAQQVGLHATTITLIEGGNRAPSLRSFVDIVAALRLSDAEILKALHLAAEGCRGLPDLADEDPVTAPTVRAARRRAA